LQSGALTPADAIQALRGPGPPGAAGYSTGIAFEGDAGFSGGGDVGLHLFGEVADSGLEGVA